MRWEPVQDFQAQPQEICAERQAQYDLGQLNDQLGSAHQKSEPRNFQFRPTRRTSMSSRDRSEVSARGKLNVVPVLGPIQRWRYSSLALSSFVNAHSTPAPAVHPHELVEVAVSVTGGGVNARFVLPVN